MLAVCARNRSLIGTSFSANWDTWGFDDPHKTQPRPTGAFFEGWLTAGSACRRNQKTIISHLRPELHRSSNGNCLCGAGIRLDSRKSIELSTG